MQQEHYLEFIHQFESGSLPKASWTHQAHLQVALWYSHQLDFDEACALVRQRIIAYNDRVGTPNTDASGYHETLTRFWMIIARQMLYKYAGLPLEMVAEKWSAGEEGDKTYPLRFYFRERLFSWVARRYWVEPRAGLWDAEWERMAWMTDRPVHHLQMADARFEHALQTCTMHPDLFTHEAHVRLAWIHIRNYGIDQAVINVCRQLQQFVAAVDAENKYHETLTVAAVRTVYHFMLKYPVDQFELFLASAPVLITDFRSLIQSHYLAQTLASDAAQITFVEPDLLPFD